VSAEDNTDPETSDDNELRLVAQEELTHARTLSWTELSRVVPWGDSYRGFAPSGREVEFERSYIWAHGEGSEILVEVCARWSPEREGCGATASCMIEPVHAR
jgi:hypothetical protein